MKKHTLGIILLFILTCSPISFLFFYGGLKIALIALGIYAALFGIASLIVWLMTSDDE